MFLTKTMRVIWKHRMRSWVFNSKTYDIRDEPFILGMTQRLNEMLKGISLTAHQTAVNEGFKLTISAARIPDAFKATLIKEEADGAWYRFENGEKGWLGPVMEIMFKSLPIVLYFGVEL